MREFRVRLFPKEREITTDGGTGTDSLAFFWVLIFVGVLALIVGLGFGGSWPFLLGVGCIVAAFFFWEKNVGRKTEEQGVENVSLRKGGVLDLRVGRLTEYDYNCVDVFYKGELVGEIRKSGIDEMIEKGALAKGKESWPRGPGFGLPLEGVSLPCPLEGAREVVPMGLVIEQIFLFCPFLFLGLMFYIFSDHIRI